jgi:hypothetical protein
LKKIDRSLLQRVDYTVQVYQVILLKLSFIKSHLLTAFAIIKREGSPIKFYKNLTNDHILLYLTKFGEVPSTGLLHYVTIDMVFILVASTRGKDVHL